MLSPAIPPTLVVPAPTLNELISTRASDLDIPPPFLPDIPPTTQYTAPFADIPSSRQTTLFTLTVALFLVRVDEAFDCAQIPPATIALTPPVNPERFTLAVQSLINPASEDVDTPLFSPEIPPTNTEFIPSTRLNDVFVTATLTIEPSF